MGDYELYCSGFVWKLASNQSMTIKTGTERQQAAFMLGVAHAADSQRDKGVTATEAISDKASVIETLDRLLNEKGG